MGVAESTPVKQGGGGSRGVQTRTMENFDMSKYIGTWYEIAHTKGSDGSKCNNAIASYSITQIPGLYQIVNTCYVDGKKVQPLIGTLKAPDPNSPSKMVATFDGLFSGKTFNYWVYATDYVNYSLVGTPSGDMWILSKNPQMGLCVFNSLISLGQRLGLGIEKKIVHDLNSLKDCEESDKEFAGTVDSISLQS
jgi:apolipoprotein D and lipocalin family protein